MNLSLWKGHDHLAPNVPMAYYHKRDSTGLPQRGVRPIGARPCHGYIAADKTDTLSGQLVNPNQLSDSWGAEAERMGVREVDVKYILCMEEED